ncbi:MAG: ABC transporter ATP-binding protein [Acidobacteriota bacterium]
MQPIIQVQNISKHFYIDTGLQSDTLKEALTKIIRSPIKSIFTKLEPKKVWSLQNISFNVMAGECVGVIGPNGSGKTTLLKLLSRILEPTSGDIEIYGKVSSLLEIGTGFHQDLTGRENIYLNGAILGMSKREIDSKFEVIVRFSEITNFLDMPVKHYSSGMYIRLAFSVAAHLESEILLLDEVFSVGDIGFQHKCEAKMRELIGNGRTVLIVSHSEKILRQFCQRVILLKDGSISAIGPTEEMLRAYRAFCGLKDIDLH